MGFGLLLIGYMFAFVATVGLGDYQFAGMLLGSLLMFFGLKELKKYSPVFLYAFIGNFFIFVTALAELGFWAVETFIGGFDLTLLASILKVFKIAVCLFFEISMLYGVADLSKRVEYPETRQKAYRNMIYVGIFNVFQLVTLMPFTFANFIGNDNRNALMFLLMMVQIVYTVFNAFLLFKCYAMICPEGQESMPVKPSRFAFVNKMRAIRNAKEEKAIEDMKNYYEDKIRAKNAKRSKKKKK